MQKTRSRNLSNSIEKELQITQENLKSLGGRHMNTVFIFYFLQQDSDIPINRLVSC
jgi:uncharacterized protein (UPF0248 family)